jgi:NADH-quinone oxidoreductase subunit A
MDASTTQQIVETSTGYFPFFITLFVAGLAAVIALVLAMYFGPKRPNKAKLAPYECGIVPEEPVHQRLDIQYYRMSIMFLIFGVEIVLFFPWALALSNAGNVYERLWALADMFIFVLILIAGYLFAWSKGGFVWRRTYGATAGEERPPARHDL